MIRMNKILTPNFAVVPTTVLIIRVDSRVGVLVALGRSTNTRMWSADTMIISDWGARPHSRASSSRLHPTGGLSSDSRPHSPFSQPLSVFNNGPYSRPATASALPPLRPAGDTGLPPNSLSYTSSAKSLRSFASRDRPPGGSQVMPSSPGSPYGSQYGSRASSPGPRSRTPKGMSRSASKTGGSMQSWLKSNVLGGHGQLTYKDWTSPDVIFDFIDTDKSGQVSKAEIMRFFRSSPLDYEKQEEMFSQLDVDGSGEVSREEWRQGFFAAGFDGTAIVGQSESGSGGE